MAPHGEAIVSSCPRAPRPAGAAFPKPPRLSSESLQRTVSDISFELSKAAAEGMADVAAAAAALPPISEVEEAKCECCGMAEECTPEYIKRVREKFMGKMVCGLCAEAVKEELQRKGGGGGAPSKAEALEAHTAACVRFNKYGRAYPVLFSAEAMREMFKKSKLDGARVRAKSISPRDAAKKPGGIARSSSCIPAITRDMSDLTMASTN